MDSPSGSVEEGEAAMESVGTTSLLPAQELVGSRTHHIQIMKASFFGNAKDDLNQTYSIQSPRLQQQQQHHTPQHSSRPSSRLDERTLSLSRPALHQSPFSRNTSLLQTSFQTSADTAVAPSPPPPHQLLPVIREQETTPTITTTSSSSSSALDPFSRFHQHHRSLRPQLTPRHAPTTPLQAQSAVLMAKRNLRVLPAAASFTDGKRERILCDHGLFLGRSFRIGWAPNWVLAHSGVQVSPSSNTSATARKGWGQDGAGLFSGRPAPPRESGNETGHPIRVVLEQVGVNSSTSIFDSVREKKCHKKNDHNNHPPPYSLSPS